MIFKKFWKALMAFVNKIANRAVAADPVAQYQLIIDTKTEEIKKGQVALSGFKGHVNRLERQLGEAEKDVKLYDNRVNLALKGGDDAAALKAGTELQRAQANYKSIEAQLLSFRGQYETQVKAIKSATEQIAQAQKRCQELGLKLKMSEANKAAAELAAEFNTTISNPTSDLAKIEEQINMQIDTNNAHAEVNADLGLTENSTQKEEQTYESLAAADLIAERKRAMGLIKDPQVAVITPVAQTALPDPRNQSATIIDEIGGGLRTREVQTLTLPAQ